MHSGCITLLQSWILEFDRGNSVLVLPQIALPAFQTGYNAIISYSYHCVTEKTSMGLWEQLDCHVFFVNQEASERLKPGLASSLWGPEGL